MSYDPCKILKEFDISHAELKTACLPTLPGYKTWHWHPEVDADHSVRAHCGYSDIYRQWSGGFIFTVDRIDTEQPPSATNRFVVVDATATYKGVCPDNFFAPIVENIQALVPETHVLWDPTLCPKCASDQTIETGIDQECCNCSHVWKSHVKSPMEAALILLATRSYTCLMHRDPGQAGLWHTMIVEALAPLGERRAGREVERCLLKFEKENNYA